MAETESNQVKQESGTKPGTLEDTLSQTVSSLQSKVCSVCHTPVSGKKRYRDGKKYWCEICWAQDSRRLQTERFAGQAAKHAKKTVRQKQLIIIVVVGAALAGVYLLLQHLG